MASTLKHLRSSTADKRPTASGLVDGQFAINTASGTPAVFFKDSNGGVVKVGPAHVGATAPNAVPAGSAGNSLGELWVDNSLTTAGLNYYTGSAFVNLTPSGTTTTVGLVELATPAETQTGTDAVRAVTPSGLQSKVSDSTSTTSSTTIASSTAVKSAYDLANAALPKAGGTVTGELLIGNTGSLVFEGSSDDSFETTIAVVDPTGDRTITFPNITGTVVTTGDSGTVTSTMIANDTIVNADVNSAAAIAYSKLALSSGIVNTDISASAAIIDTKLATISTADKVGISALDIDGATDIGGALEGGDLFIVDDGAGGTNRKAPAFRMSQLVYSGVTGDIAIASGGTASISAGVIVNADINSSAAIDFSKLASLTSANILLGNASNVATSTAVTGDVTISNAGVTAIAAGVIVDGDINASAAIAHSKLASITAGQVLLGNASNVPTSTALSGDVTVNSSGVTAISTGVIVNADVNASAAIAGTKISPDFGSQTITTTGVVSAALGAAATPSITFTGDLNTGIYSPGADQVAISTNGSGRLFVDSSGNVGVGNSSQTSYNGAADNLVIGSSGSNGMTIVSSSTGAGYIMFADGTTGQQAYEGQITYDHTNNYLALNTSGTERLRITSAGLVGVGTSSPSAQLQIFGAGQTTAAFDTSSNLGGAIYLRDSAANAGNGGAVVFGASQGAFAAIKGLITNGNSNTFGDIAFSTRQAIGDATLTERLRITNTGLVGVGTTTPGSYESGKNNLVIANTSGSSGLTIASATTGYGEIAFADGTSGSEKYRGQISYDHTNDALSFYSAALQRATIDSSGRLLVGTSSTSYGSAGAFINRAAGTSSPGNTFRAGGWSMYSIGGEPALVLSSNINTSGAGTSTETARGGIGFEYINASEPTRMVIGTVTASTVPSPVTFWTEGTERMRITSNGNIGINLTPTGSFADGNGVQFLPGGVVYSNRTSNPSATFGRNTTTGDVVTFAYGSTATNPGLVGSVSVTASATAYNTSSDYRLKENVEPVTDGIARLLQLKPSRFNFIVDPDTTVDGFIAHEAQEVVPECVTGEKDAVDGDGNPVYQGIDQSKLVPLLTAALQEAIGRIEALEAEVAALKAQ